jgi:hypothetical protein
LKLTVLEVLSCWKLVENNQRPEDIPQVITTKADNRKRVVVPQAKPGQVYAVGESADGGFTLTVIKPAKVANLKCRLAKEDGFTVVAPGQPINEQAIKEFLAEFP